MVDNYQAIGVTLQYRSIFSISLHTGHINSLTASPYFIPQPPEARLLLNLGVFGTSLAPKLINLP